MVAAPNAVTTAPAVARDAPCTSTSATAMKAMANEPSRLTALAMTRATRDRGHLARW